MERINQNTNEPKNNKNVNNEEYDDNSEYSEEEDLDQMEEIPDNDDAMELEDEDNNGTYNSDADTFNTSGHPLPQLKYLESQFFYHNDAVLSLALNPADKNEFVTGGMDDQIAIWSIKDESPIYSNKFNESVDNVTVSYDGGLVACSVLDNNVKVFKRQQNNEFVEKATFTGFDDEISVG